MKQGKTVLEKNIKDQKQKIFHFFQQGSFNQAIEHCMKCDPKELDPDIQKVKLASLQKLARKYWRQDKHDEFASLFEKLGDENLYLLAHARLLGCEALSRLSKSDRGIPSKLAHCSIQADTKTSLLAMRQVPELKLIAEGWLALLKGDNERAASSFEEASSLQPLRGNLGRGIVSLLEGKYADAQQLFAPLRPYAHRRFPQLAKAMGWEETQKESLSLLAPLLQNPKLSELIEAEKKCSPSNKELRGWIYLKIGDLLVHSSVKKAFLNWDHAVKYHPALKLDVLKRRLLAAFVKKNEEIKVNGPELFLAFYKELRKKSEGDARSFVESACFDHSISLELIMHFSCIHNNGKWIIDPPPIELKMLWLFLASLNTTNNLVRVIGLPGGPYDDLCGLPTVQWIQLFADLDSHYSNKEAYLLLKLTFCRLIGHLDLTSETAKQLLHLSPHLEAEILPSYTKPLHLLRTHSDSHLTQKKKYAEIEQLRQLFPSDFELIHLSILFGVSSPNIDEVLLKYTSNLSEPLLDVLKLHVWVSSGKKSAWCRKFMPSLELLQRSREASWRFLALLLNPKFGLPKKDIQGWVEKLSTDDETQHEFFSKILKYYNYLPPFSILQKWSRSCPENWKPYYFLTLHYAEKGDIDSALTMLF